jgi:hypothetical protein
LVEPSSDLVMPSQFPLTTLVAIACSVASVAARGDAPLRTDNADVPDRGNCKVESWYEGTPGSPAFVVTPACVPFSVVEFGAAFARAKDDDGTWGNAFAAQAKVPILKKRDDRHLALATTVSVARSSSNSGGGIEAVWLNVPASIYLMEDRWRIHLNAGGLWRHADSDVFTWGAATECDAGPVTWLAEAYRIDSGTARYNAGARYEAAEGFSVYVSAGRRFGGESGDWLVTAGIRFESPTALRWLGEKTAAAGRALAVQDPSTQVR